MTILTYWPGQENPDARTHALTHRHRTAIVATIYRAHDKRARQKRSKNSLIKRLSINVLFKSNVTRYKYYKLFLTLILLIHANYSMSFL